MEEDLMMTPLDEFSQKFAEFRCPACDRITRPPDRCADCGEIFTWVHSVGSRLVVTRSLKNISEIPCPPPRG